MRAIKAKRRQIHAGLFAWELLPQITLSLSQHNRTNPRPSCSYQYRVQQINTLAHGWVFMRPVSEFKQPIAEFCSFYCMLPCSYCIWVDDSFAPATYILVRRGNRSHTRGKASALPRARRERRLRGLAWPAKPHSRGCGGSRFLWPVCERANGEREEGTNANGGGEGREKSHLPDRATVTRRTGCSRTNAQQQQNIRTCSYFLLYSWGISYWSPCRWTPRPANDLLIFHRSRREGGGAASVDAFSLHL